MKAEPTNIEINPLWERLTKTEQQLLASKLSQINNPRKSRLAADPQTARIFDNLIYVTDDVLQTENKLLTIQNFLGQIGARTEIWQQLAMIIGVENSYLEITVHHCETFLQVLRKHDFAVNSWLEKIGRLLGKGHRFDSARARTDHRFQPQLHFANDRADEEPFGENYFFVHWDAQSVVTRHGSLLGKIAAGRSHTKYPATAAQIAGYLREKAMAGRSGK